MIFEKLKFWERKDKKIISFYCHPDLYGVVPEPELAIKHLPKWFKDLEHETEGEDMFGNPHMTAKMCLPLIDNMSLGYIIKLAGDVRIRSNRNCLQIDHIDPPAMKLIDYHPSEQVGGRDKLKPNQGKIIKFLNPWVIRTAPGWSTLIEPIPNVFDSPFTCLSALVDTDVYAKEINFPAVWNIPDADISLKAGTPLVRVIPIQRSSISKIKDKNAVRKMSPEEYSEIAKMDKIQKMRSHYYTHELRVKK